MSVSLRGSLAAEQGFGVTLQIVRERANGARHRTDLLESLVDRHGHVRARAGLGDAVWSALRAASDVAITLELIAGIST